MAATNGYNVDRKIKDQTADTDAVNADADANADERLSFRKWHLTPCLFALLLSYVFYNEFYSTVVTVRFRFTVRFTVTLAKIHFSEIFITKIL